jgi:hypothetical protein
MMGPTKLSTIRERVRKSFKMTDAELLAWFNRKMEERQEKPDANTEIATLRLFRDALKKEATRPKPKPKPGRVTTTKR